MPRERLSRRGRAIFAAIIAVLILVAAAYFSRHGSSDKKDNRPLGPTATLEEVKALQATPAIDCSTIADKAKLEDMVGASLRQPFKRDGNSDGGPKVVVSQYCDYSPKGSRTPLAQTSYCVVTTEGLKVYQMVRAGKDNSLKTTVIPKSDLPSGIDDGYDFVPHNSLSEYSVYQNPGFALRAGHQVVTVGFKGFSEQLPVIKWDFMYHAAERLLASK